MTPASYVITFDGPGSASFTRDTTNSEERFYDIVKGDWIITVHAKNADRTIIADGTSTTTVTPGQIAQVSITVRPLNGFGSLDVTVQWDPTQTVDPEIIAKLKAPDNTETPLPFTMAVEGVANNLTSALGTGYYTMIVKLMENLDTNQY